MREKIAVLYTFLVLSLIACSSPTSDSGKIKNLDGYVGFYIYEKFTDPELENDRSSKIVIDMISGQNFPCGEYQIVADQESYSNRIKIEVLGYQEPEQTCADREQPASLSLDLGIDEGKYYLELQNQNFFEFFEINVSDWTIDVKRTGQIKDTLLFSNGVDRSYRFRENSFLLTYGYSMEYDQLYEKFIDSLNQSFELKTFDYPKDGINPYTYTNEGILFRDITYYLYPDSTDFNKIGEFVRDFPVIDTSLDGNIQFFITSWKNQRYNTF